MTHHTPHFFTSISRESKKFFEDFGFVHYRLQSADLINLIHSNFAYYNKSISDDTFEYAFKNSDGSPRHIINVFRDRNSPALELYRHSQIKSLISLLAPSSTTPGIFTHSKLSYKLPNADSDWLPHQDNGYKKNGESLDSFAIFICLEPMDTTNGNLLLYPKSHILGLLRHEGLLENIKSGDTQQILDTSNLIEDGLPSCDIIAEAGDIVVFHGNTIHASGKSNSQSMRLALISEVEFSNSLRLDDAGLLPVLAYGDVALARKLNLIFSACTNKRSLIRYCKHLFPKLFRFIKLFKNNN